MLHGEWGYEGVVITDWWMRLSDPDFDLGTALPHFALRWTCWPGAIDHAGTPDPPLWSPTARAA